jgi:energy-converting hydrogenase A subunit M
VEKNDASPTMTDKCKAFAAAAQVEHGQAQMSLVEAKDNADAAVAWLLDQLEQQEQQAKQAKPKAAAPMARIQYDKSMYGACARTVQLALCLDEPISD